MKKPLSPNGIHGFRGQLITPSCPAYETERRVWNGMIDRRPAAIAQCQSVGDVVSAILYATESGALTAVRGGGHSIPGHSVCDGGLVIDLARMNSVQFDPWRAIVTAQGGSLLRDLDRTVQAKGLVVPAGVVSHTGVGGLSLGGGFGHLMRKHGLTIDSLTSATVVTADGNVLEANEHEHPDLFWALRGGGGNFGVVTDFVFAPSELSQIYMAVCIHRLARARPVLAKWRDTMGTAPDELSWSSFFRRAPPFPWVASHLNDEPVLMSSIAWCGEAAQGERIVGLLAGSLEADSIYMSAIPFLDLQSTFDAMMTHGSYAYCKAGFIDVLSDSALDALVQQGYAIASDRSQLEVIPLGGRIDRVDPAKTAYPHRGRKWVVNALGVCTDRSQIDATVDWARDTYHVLGPFLADGAYVNYMGGEEEGGCRAAYGATLRRLQAVKAQYDPHNFFSSNQNILPCKPT